MKIFARASVLGVLLSFLLIGSVHAAPEGIPRCKSSYIPADRFVSYTNLGLDQQGETNYEDDCATIYTEILSSGKLPVVSGERMPAHLVYELPSPDLFPMIEKFLAASELGKLKLVIRFSLPAEAEESEPFTTLVVDAMDRPALD